MNLDARTAIEALRAGVPNRAAIRLMGTEESGVEQAFDALLASAWPNSPGFISPGSNSAEPNSPGPNSAWPASASPQSGSHQSGGARPGIGIAGGFGTGKSHLLGYLSEVARTHDFVVSRVVVSKETPLSDPARVFEAAMRNTVVPNHNDDAIAACLAILREAPERLDALERTISQPDASLAPVFAVILYLLRKGSTPAELIRRFERFLSGGRMTATAFRQALSSVGAGRMFDPRLPPAAVLTEQRIRFVSHLFHAAGFAGWCLLLDEVELIGRYTPLQRGLAYAWLSVWLGLDPARRFPGIVTVYAITDDFVAAVIDPRQDDEKLPERLRLKGRGQDAVLALAAIHHVEHTVRQRRLRLPGLDELDRTCLRLREIYEAAHDWLPTELPQSERTATRTMRQYIKSWITQWDLQRLTGSGVAIVEQTITANYEENDGLGTIAPDEPGDEWS